MNDRLRRLLACVFALVLVLQPAFALRLSCAAVGKLFPERCCCRVAAAEQPSCCAERATSATIAADSDGPRALSPRACTCGFELPERPSAAHEAGARAHGASKSLADAWGDPGAPRIDPRAVCELASADVARSWALAALDGDDPSGGERASSSAAPRGAGLRAIVASRGVASLLSALGTSLR